MSCGGVRAEGDGGATKGDGHASMAFDGDVLSGGEAAAVVEALGDSRALLERVLGRESRRWVCGRSLRHRCAVVSKLAGEGEDDVTKCHALRVSLLTEATQLSARTPARKYRGCAFFLAATYAVVGEVFGREVARVERASPVPPLTRPPTVADDQRHPLMHRTGAEQVTAHDSRAEHCLSAGLR